MGKLKFGSSKSEFGLRSGNKSSLPFKEMGSSPVKQGLDLEFVGGEIVPKKKDSSEGLLNKLKNYKDTTQKENIDKQVQKVVDKTDNDIASTKKKDLDERKYDLKVRQQDFLEKKYADKNKPVEKPSMTAEEIKKGKSKAKARDIFTTMSSGKAEFGYQQAFEDKIAGMDVKTAEKTENQEELPPAEQFVEDDSYVTASTGGSRTGTEIFGGIDEKKNVKSKGSVPVYGENPRQDDRNYDKHGNYKPDNPEIYAGEKPNYQPGDPEFEKKKAEILKRYETKTT